MFGMGDPDGPGRGSTAGGGFDHGQGGGAGDAGGVWRNRLWGLNQKPAAAPKPMTPNPIPQVVPPQNMIAGGGGSLLSPQLMQMIQQWFGGNFQVPTGLGAMMAPMTGGPSLPPEQRGV